MRDLIALRFGKTLGLSTVQLYLQRWGMTPQKPLARARERQPAAVAAWLEQHYPAIAKRAKAEGAAIYWGDETGISNQDQIGRSYAPKGPDARGRPDGQADHPEHDLGGQQPRPDALHVLRGGAERRPVHRLPAAAGQGRRAEGVPDRRQPQGAPCRQGQDVGGQPMRHEIELFYLPAYAPDHNPDEYLNNDLKQKLRQQPQPASQDELIKNTRAVLRAIQRSPRRIQAYFKPPAVRYAA